MDPGWPENPADGIVCILCKSVLPFKGNPDKFFRHIMHDHNTYHNLNIVLELSLTQPYRDYGSGIGVEFIGPMSPPPDDLDISQEEEISIFVKDEEKYQVPLPEGPMDFSQLDPISFVNQIRPKTKVKMEQNDVNSQGTSIPLTNPNRHLVPEELQRLLVISNPDRSIKFTYSQRLNTQLVLDDFILKKKKGPYLSRTGESIINWRCVESLCQFGVTTIDGHLGDSGRVHNHLPQPELYVRKQAYYRVKEDLALGTLIEQPERGLTSLVHDVLEDTEPDQRKLLGSVDAMKQAARRYSRNLKRRGFGGEGGQNQGYNLGGEILQNAAISLPDIPGLDPNAEYFDIVENIKDEPGVEEPTEPEPDCNLEEFAEEAVDEFFETV